MLESKNRVMSKIARTGSKHTNVKPLQETMDDLNRRFQVKIMSLVALILFLGFTLKRYQK